MTSSPLLEVKNLTRTFEIPSGSLIHRTPSYVRAVEDVSFTVQEGESLALVGESGCGKTTLAKVLLRLLDPTSGQVLINGVDIRTLKGAALRQYRMQVQAVFQDPWASLSPRMKVYDTVAETLVVNEKLTRKELTRRVDESLTAVGLRPEHARNYPHEFSGGQRQRVAIASAIIARPKLMVLDEPVSALDVSIRSQIMNLFKDLQAQYGCSYVVVAHDLGTTRYMADKIAVMYLGRLVELGQTDTLFDDPRHPYTEALLSAALPLNPTVTHSPVVLKGEVPSPINPPSGCHFHPRCHRYIGEKCADQSPEFLVQPKHDHGYACHLSEHDPEIIARAGSGDSDREKTRMDGAEV